MKEKKGINEQNIIDINYSLWNKKNETSAEEKPYYYYIFSYGLYTIYIRKNRKQYQICGRLPKEIIKNWRKKKQETIEKRKLFDIYEKNKDFYKITKKYIELTKDIIKYFENNDELNFYLTELEQKK